MRDPKRIEPLLDTLRKLWAKSPDMRFIQLLNYITDGRNCAEDLFYMEDDELLNLLKDKIHN